MRNLKRVLSLALALVMVLGMMVIGTSAATYTDADEITYKEAVEVMSAIGILTGDAGKFNPKGTLTREGAAKIIAYVCLGEDADSYLTGAVAPFEDVAADRWSAKYVAYCKNLGIIDGVTPTTFNPKGNISVVGFAKLLLGAIEVEGKYTGAGWEENVKKAVASVPAMAATGIKITNANITREEACELALAAMKAGETYSNGWFIEGYEEEFGYCATYAEAYIMAKAMEVVDPVITKHSDVRDSLLKDTYEVTFNPDAADKFGRPGNSYTYEVDNEEVVLFFADKALATFEGPVAEKDIFAAAKAAATATSISYKLIEDGSKKFEGQTFTAAKAEKAASANWTAAGTGYGIKTELYKEGTAANPVYTLVSIREYLGTVTKVNPADPKVPTSKRSVVVTLDVVPSGNETTKTITYTTEDFAEKDVVVVTVAGAKIQTIALAEAVEGKVTKITDTGVYTIGEKEYVKSQNWTGSIELSGTEGGAWYVDSFGNLLGVKSAPQAPADVWYFGVVLDAEGQLYKAATEGSLLEAGKDAKEAAEVIQILTSEGKEVVFNTAWEYTKDDEGEITGVEFVNDGAGEGYDPAITSGLVKYTLKDGKIEKIAAIASESGKATTTEELNIKKGEATLDGKFVNDNTLYFVMDAKNSVIYTGYNAIPTKGLVASEYEYFYAATATGYDSDSIAAVLVSVESVNVSAEPEYDLVWFAGLEKYTTKAGKDTITTFTNVYINGVKGEISFKNDLPLQLNGVKDGEYEDCGPATLYIVSFDKDGYAKMLFTGPYANIGKVDESNRELNRIASSYIVCGSDTYYVGANTEYFQVDSTTYAVEKVDGLPALSATGAYDVMVITVGGLGEYEGVKADKPADIVYFYVAD